MGLLRDYFRGGTVIHLEAPDSCRGIDSPPTATPIAQQLGFIGTMESGSVFGVPIPHAERAWLGESEAGQRLLRSLDNSGLFPPQ